MELTLAQDESLHKISLSSKSVHNPASSQTNRQSDMSAGGNKFKTNTSSILTLLLHRNSFYPCRLSVFMLCRPSNA